ncbi:Smg-4/UPF3 family-domain-containing protein [Mycena floridula]|nr:Smg-4/UPF3 family-domain-containing protein [Mycena floridula]
MASKNTPAPGAERLKAAVRRLPPNLPEDIFWQSVQPWVSDESVTWKEYQPGKLRKRLNKENIPSRAYIAFKTEEQLGLFSREYDGHLFRDKAGLEYQAVVEFAPYQKIPIEKKKLDNRNATIESDEHYQSFIASLSGETLEPVSIETLMAAAQTPVMPKTTPLLEALKAEKAANKDKEAILRNHAHYKDQTILAGPRPKKEDKKKPPPTAKPGDSPPLGKKAAKRAAAAAAAAAATAGPSADTASVKTAGATKPPKPPKAPKQAAPAKAPVPVPSTSTASPAEAEANSTLPAGARRSRPVIGLGRQFEAALTGAGVGTSKAARARKEKETPGPAAKPPSPKKDKVPKRKEGEETSGQIPSILQREPPVILQRDSPRISTVEPGEKSPGPSATFDIGGPARGGKRRGRGRGGPPIGAARGG